MHKLWFERQGNDWAPPKRPSRDSNARALRHIQLRIRQRAMLIYGTTGNEEETPGAQRRATRPKLLLSRRRRARSPARSRFDFNGETDRNVSSTATPTRKRVAATDWRHRPSKSVAPRARRHATETGDALPLTVRPTGSDTHPSVRLRHRSPACD